MTTIYIDINYDDNDYILNRIKLLLDKKLGLGYIYERLPSEELRKYTTDVSDVISTEKCKTYITHRHFGQLIKSPDSWDIFVHIRKPMYFPFKNLTTVYYRTADKKGRYDTIKFSEEELLITDELLTHIRDLITLATMPKLNYSSRELLINTFFINVNI